MTPSRTRRAMTLVEIAVTLAIVATLSVGLVLSIRGGDVAATDASAKNRLDAALNAAVDYYVQNGSLPLNSATLAQAPGITVTVVNSDTAATTGTVSAQVAAGSVSVATRAADGSCWLAAMTTTATAGTTPKKFAFSPAGGSTPCTGTAASSFAISGGKGTSWLEPMALP